MKPSWKERGFLGWRELSDLPYPTVLTAVLAERAPGEGQARGILVLWARSADAARQSIRQHFGTYYAAKARVSPGAAFVDEVSDLLPGGLPPHVLKLAAEAGEGAQLLEYAVFGLCQPLRRAL